MEILECIKSRRSTRVYSDKTVSQSDIDKIVEAGRYAPSGGNNRSVHFIVIQNKEILEELVKLVKDTFAGMEMNDGMYKSIFNSIRASKSGNYVFNYHAPVLIVTANKIGYPNGLADCSCAIENMMLMANELDLGSCWINQLRWLKDNENIIEYLRKLGMCNDEEIWGSVAIGYAKNDNNLPERKPLDRTGNKVTYIK